MAVLDIEGGFRQQGGDLGRQIGFLPGRGVFRPAGFFADIGETDGGGIVTEFLQGLQEQGGFLGTGDQQFVRALGGALERELGLI